MCTFFKSYAFLILVTSNAFCFKCMLYRLPFGNNDYNKKGCSRNEKSGRANTLIFKNIGQKLKKIDFLHSLLTFSTTGESKCTTTNSPIP